MTPVYAIVLKDQMGCFNWIYTYPRPFYTTRQEAEEVRERLIEVEDKITQENSKVQTMFKIEQ